MAGCTHVYKHVRTHVYTHIHTHVYTHVYAQVAQSDDGWLYGLLMQALSFMTYIAMAYVVMAYIVMAYMVMAYTVMAVRTPDAGTALFYSQKACVPRTCVQPFAFRHVLETCVPAWP